MMVRLGLMYLISHSFIGAYRGLKSMHKVKLLHNQGPISKREKVDLV